MNPHWAVVVVTGEDILRFLSRDEVAESLPVESQAEIAFGFEQSQEPTDDLLYLAESALTQDEIWQEDAEPELAKLRPRSHPRPAAERGRVGSEHRTRGPSVDLRLATRLGSALASTNDVSPAALRSSLARSHSSR